MNETEKQSRIVQRMENLQAEPKRLQAICTATLANLDERKGSLLQKAFTGQLTNRVQMPVEA